MEALFPFAWLDVALVYFICALPLAWTLATLIRQRTPTALSMLVAGFFLAVGLLPVRDAFRDRVVDSDPSLGAVLRAGTAFSLAVAVALVAGLVAAHTAPARSSGWRKVVGVQLLLLLLVPSIYVAAHCRHDIVKLAQLIKHERVGDALVLARGLVVLDPARELRGTPLRELAPRLQRIVRELEARVSLPLPATAAGEERLQRARELAQLGRTEAAIDVLQTLTEPALQAETASLRGTIEEAKGDWATALAWHERAQSASPARSDGLLRATKNIAYCQRQLGQYAQAEKSYQEVLALSPTAETHFLLAKFYEDSQQAEKARTHARLAMALDPDNFRLAGDRLINKLAVYHFGCLGVFAAEQEPAERFK